MLSREIFQYSTALLSLTSIPTLLKARQNIRNTVSQQAFIVIFSDDGVMAGSGFIINKLQDRFWRLKEKS